MNFFEFNKLFSTELDCINYFIKIRYGNAVRCNHCKSTKVYHKSRQPKLFDCFVCKNSFSIFKDTIFEKSDTDLRKWFYAIHLFLNSKKGISGYQLQREIGVTYKCAWRILKKIREAMSNSETRDMFNGMIEVDETYVGKDDEDDDTPPKKGRGTNKNVVVGVLDRNNKIVKAEVMKKNLVGSKISSEQLLSVINKIIKEDTTIITDEFKGYNLVSKNTNHKHLRVNHSKSYVGENGEHVNNIESFFSTLKRGIIGIYHHVSSKYIQSYVDEFCFRYNNKSNGDVFNLVLRQSIIL
jgi:transposase-like protein